MLRDFERWPKYKELYIKAFDKMIANHPGEIRIASGQYALTGAEQCSENGQNGVGCERNCESNTHTHKLVRTTKDGYKWTKQKSGAGSWGYNPNPRVADFKSAEDVFRAYIKECKYGDL